MECSMLQGLVSLHGLLNLYLPVSLILRLRTDLCTLLATELSYVLHAAVDTCSTSNHTCACCDGAQSGLIAHPTAGHWVTISNLRHFV